MTKNVNQEQEVLGEIDKELFNELKTKFTKEYGSPKEKKRLAISFWDPVISQNLDTRIRITNGSPEVMQKSGEWENREILDQREIALPLPKNVEDVYNAYLLFLSYSKKEFPPRIIQHRSQIFDTPDFEIKLAVQFGASDKYIFEIEKTGKADLLEFTESLGLIKYILKTDAAFWLKWNKKVNLSTKDLSEKEIKGIINKYL